MSTRRDIKDAPNTVPGGFEGTDSPTDFKIPPCTIEDVDRAVFNLFDKQLPMQSNSKQGRASKRIPVIFATGERFAVLRRKIPLSDRGDDHGALILPLISITRGSITQDPDNGIGPGQAMPIVIKRRLSKDSPLYKRLINENQFENQDEVASSAHNLTGAGSGSLPGTVGTRREQVPQPPESRVGKVLRPQLSNNIYETLTIPPVKYYTATYSISLWSQYTQEMNEMLMTLMSLYQNNHRRTFKLETSKGYWFVGYVASDISPENNTDEYTDKERILKYNFDIKVNGYIIAPEYPGSPAYVRRYVSAPSVEFGTFSIAGRTYIGSPAPQRNDPSVFVIEDIYSDTNDLPDSGVAAKSPQDAVTSLDYHNDRGSATVGSYNTRDFHSTLRTVVTNRNVFTGEEKNNILTVKSVNPRKGETVFREQLIPKLEDI